MRSIHGAMLILFLSFWLAYWMIPFEGKTAPECQCFWISLTTPKIVPSLRVSGPLSNTWFLGSFPKRHINRFSRFRRVHERDQHTHTDRQADRPHYSVYSNRPLSLRCGLIILLVTLYKASTCSSWSRDHHTPPPPPRQHVYSLVRYWYTKLEVQRSSTSLNLYLEKSARTAQWYHTLFLTVRHGKLLPNIVLSSPYFVCFLCFRVFSFYFFTHADRSSGGGVRFSSASVCLSVFPHDISKTDATRITELDKQTFQDTIRYDIFTCVQKLTKRPA